MMGTEKNIPRIPAHAAQNTVDYRPEVFLHQSN